MRTIRMDESALKALRRAVRESTSKKRVREGFGQTLSGITDDGKAAYDVDHSIYNVSKFMSHWKLNDEFMNIVLPEMGNVERKMFTDFKEQYGRWPKITVQSNGTKKGTDPIIQATVEEEILGPFGGHTGKTKRVPIGDQYNRQDMTDALKTACLNLLNQDPDAKKYANKTIKDEVEFEEAVEGLIAGACRVAAIAIPVVCIGGYVLWSIADDIDLSYYYDDSFTKKYGVGTPADMPKVVTHYVSDGKGGEHSVVRTEKGNFEKAQEAYFRVVRWAKKHNETLGQAAKECYRSAEWKVLFSMFGWGISEDDENVYLSMNYLGKTRNSGFANQKFTFSKTEYADGIETTETQTFSDQPGVTYSWTESRKRSSRKAVRESLNIKYTDVLNGYGSAKKAQDFYDMVNEAIDEYEGSLNALPGEDARMLTHGSSCSDLCCGYCGAEIEYGQDTCPECGAHLNTSLDDCCGSEEDCLCDEFTGLEEKVYKLPTRFTPKKDTHWKGAKKAPLQEGGYVNFINHIGEKDSFYDPNKPEPSLADLDADAMASYDVGSGSDYWLKRFEGKTPDYNSVEGLTRLANIWYNTYFSDQVHDLAHDGAYQDSKDCARALNQMYSKIAKAVTSLGLTSSNTSEALQTICQDVEKKAKNTASAQKRAATKAANQDARLEKYKAMALQTQNAELRALLNDDGTLKTRGSWKTIKNYLSDEDGKTFKNLWVNQFK